MRARELILVYFVWENYKSVVVCINQDIKIWELTISIELISKIHYSIVLESQLEIVKFIPSISQMIYSKTIMDQQGRCPWCNGYRCRKWTRDETDCISHSTNTLGKGMNPIILPPAIVEQTGFFILV